MSSLDRDTREIIIGALSLLVFAVIFALVSARGESSSATEDDFNRITALFSRVDGLLPGDEVRLGGIKIGYVESQHIDESFHAVLTFAVRKDVPLPLDTSAAIHTNGLFGSKFIVLEPGGEYDFMQDGDEIIYTQDSVVVEDLLELIINEGKAKRAAQNQE